MAVRSQRLCRPHGHRTRASAYGLTDFPMKPAYTLGPGYPTPGPPILLRPPVAHNGLRWYRNVDLFPIDYAFRPRLRDRLTLGGRTFPRKPWVYGEQDSRLFYRYSYRHSHFHSVQPFFRSTFSLEWNAPLPVPGGRHHQTIRGFGEQLSPVNFRRGPARPVSCYALFK